MRCFLMTQTVNNLPAIQETWVWSLGWQDPLETGMATHSSIMENNTLENDLENSMDCIFHEITESWTQEWHESDLHFHSRCRRYFDLGTLCLNTYPIFKWRYHLVFDCVDRNKLWKILKEMGKPDHLTCFLRNLYAGQEASACRLEPDLEQQTGSKWERGTSRLCIVALLI